jgi:hypothetical protein
MAILLVVVTTRLRDAARQVVVGIAQRRFDRQLHLGQLGAHYVERQAVHRHAR